MATTSRAPDGGGQPERTPASRRPARRPPRELPPPAPLWKVLPLGLLGIVLTTAASVAAVSWAWSWLGFILPFVLGITVLAVGAGRWNSGGLIFAGFVALFAGLGGAYGEHRYVLARQGVTVTELSPTEASAHPEAGAFVFRGAVHMRDLQGRYVYRRSHQDGSQQRVVYTVYPVVPAGWTRADPVPVWAGSTDARSRRARASDLRVGMRVDTSSRSGYGSAIADARRAHRLRSVSGAPVLRFVASREQAIAKARAMVWIMPGVLAGLWVVLVVFFRKG